MTGFKVVNLLLLTNEIGEDATESILSDFSCPKNGDVEYFLKTKAISFAKQGWAQTHLVFASYKEKPVLVGYFALSNKNIRISSKLFQGKSSTLRKRIAKFARFDPDLKAYILAAPLIAQLGKNYTNGYNRLIGGGELLSEACNKISKVQLDLGGRFAYLECEGNEKLTTFYCDNGFCDFDRRTLDKDEVDRMHIDYLVQMLKYIHN